MNTELTLLPVQTQDASSSLGSPFDQPDSPGMATVEFALFGGSLPVANLTVGEIRERLSDRLQLPPGSQATLDGIEVGDDARVRAGQLLRFSHKAGMKGRRRLG